MANRRTDQTPACKRRSLRVNSASFKPILKEKYEVVIIGSGLGALCAAVSLARAGAEVLVLEQGIRPGGCFSSFKKDDFTYDCVATLVNGFGNVGFNVLRTVFDSLGQQIEVIPQEVAYTLYLGEHRLDVKRDQHAFTSDLGAIFPQQAGSILSLMREMELLYHSVLDFSGPPRPKTDESPLQRMSLFIRHPASVLRMSRYARLSAARVISKHLDDPEARSFFEADLFYNTGYSAGDLSAPHASLALLDRHIGGTHYVIGSLQQIPDRLEKVLTDHGSTAAYRIPVERVLVEAGRAVGVCLEGGLVVLADAVIAGVSVRQLYERLLDPEVVLEDTRKWISSLESAPGVLTLYAGVREEAVPEDLNPITVLVEDPRREPHRYVSVSVPSLRDPNLAPPGHHSMTIHAVTDPAKWPSPSDPAYQTDEYEFLKREEATRIISRLESLLPGLSEAVVDLQVATPTTMERFTLREKGALAGPRLKDMLSQGSSPGICTGIRGLYLVGDSTCFGRGASLVAASGVFASLAVMRLLGIGAPQFTTRVESSVLETVPVRPEISGGSVIDTISAVQEAHRCQFCLDAPCMKSCPASVDIPNFIRRIQSANFSGAARLIREANPLGEVCGNVCPVDILCESACVRASMDSPVRIGELEAFACSYAAGEEGWPPPYRGRRRERVAVVGSGPAGISCAYFLSRLGYNVEIFEEDIQAGGLPARSMPDFRLNIQSLMRDMEGALMSGVEFRGNTSFGDDINFDSLAREGFKAVFLGTGLQSMRFPRVKGSDLPGIIDVLSFLSAARRKVKRELTKKVAVLGNSNIAVDAALSALKMGAEKVCLITSYSESEMAATPGRIRSAVEAGVELLTERRLLSIEGKGRVEGVRTLPVIGGSAAEAGEGHYLEVGTVILSGLQEPKASLADYLAGHLRIREDSTVEVDESTMMTTRQGVFAGGDLVNGGDLVVTACADGRRAALSIDRYLGGRSKTSAEAS